MNLNYALLTILIIHDFSTAGKPGSTVDLCFRKAARSIMDLAQAIVEDARILLAVAVGGFWAALAVIVGSGLACLAFSLITTISRLSDGRSRRGSVRSAWR
jgi:hypothetical protein